MSQFQPNPTIIAKVIDHFVNSNFQDHFHSGPLCGKLHLNYFIWEFLSRPLHFSLFPAQWQDSSYSNRSHSTGPLRTSRWHFRSGRVMSPLHWKHPIFPKKDGMPALLVSWAPKASSDGSILRFPKNDDLKKIPDNIFKAFTNTLEVSMSHWNYIDEMYSDIWQGEQKTTDHLDQCIKILVERCGYMSAEEKTQCQLKLLFHVTKHFEVKKWVRSKTALNETVTFDKLLQHAKQHEATIKGLPMTQVQQRSCNVNHNQWDQDLQAMERSRP